MNSNMQVSLGNKTILIFFADGVVKPISIWFGETSHQELDISTFWNGKTGCHCIVATEIECLVHSHLFFRATNCLRAQCSIASTAAWAGAHARALPDQYHDVDLLTKSRSIFSITLHLWDYFNHDSLER